MNNETIGNSVQKGVENTFEISIHRELTDTEKQYIFDCWCEFWCSDLGYFPNEYTMILH